MKTAAILATTAIAMASVVPGSLEHKFEEFMTAYHKTYRGAEKEARFAIFRDNVARIQKLNFENPDKLFDVNQFADLTDSERNHINYTGFRASLPAGMDGAELVGSDYINENRQGKDHAHCYQTVRDQGQCGSCWAFATAATVEGAYCIKYGKQLNLAPQNLVDCDKKEAGCNGAYELTEPFDFVRDNGLCTENDYHYEARNNVCRSDACKEKYTVKNFIDLSGKSADKVIEALETYGPLSVGVAVGFEFQMYKGGVLDKKGCGRANLNHAVTLVGYEKLEDGDYAFKIRNSWGGSWGEAGHIRVKWGACQLGAMAIATEAGALPTGRTFRF